MYGVVVAPCFPCVQRALDAERQKFDEDTERLIATSNKVRDQSAAVAKARAAAAAERARAQQLRDECAALAAQADADKQVVESVASDIKVRARARFAASTHLTRVGWLGGHATNRMNGSGWPKIAWILQRSAKLPTTNDRSPRT